MSNHYVSEPSRNYNGSVYHSAPSEVPIPSNISISIHQSHGPPRSEPSPYSVSDVGGTPVKKPPTPPTPQPPPTPRAPQPSPPMKPRVPPTTAPPPPPANPSYHSYHTLIDPKRKPSKRSSKRFDPLLNKLTLPKNRGMFRLCLIELLLGVGILFGGLWCADVNPMFCPYYSALWTSGIFIGNAVLGLVATKLGNHRVFLAHLILSMICVMVAVVSCLLSGRNWNLIGSTYHPSYSAFCILDKHYAKRISHIYTNMERYNFSDCLYSLKVGMAVNSVQFAGSVVLGILNLVSVLFCLRRTCSTK